MELIWGDPENKDAQYGVSKTVIHREDASFAWSGVTAIKPSKKDARITQSFFDGNRTYLELPPTSAGVDVDAIQYPLECMDLLGQASVRQGVVLQEQPTTPFGLTFETEMLGGKILHIFYNCRFTSNDRVYRTRTKITKPTQLKFKILCSSSPYNFSTPTAYVSIKLNLLSEAIRQNLERELYGSTITNPGLPSSTDLMDILR